jgi:predicted GIY-YIG superfamily endonuclease
VSHVINLTDVELSVSAISVLNKGFNFAVAPRTIPVEKIIIGIETAISHFPKPMSEEIRQDVSSIIRKQKPPNQNLPYNERQALKELRDNPDIVILKSDKGNSSVIMKSKEYKEKMLKLLSDPIYEKLNRNPTTTYESKLTTLLHEAPIHKDLIKELSPSDSRVPKIYGLPKYHKQDVPLRPIVCAIKAPAHDIARFTAQFFQKECDSIKSNIINSTHLLEQIKQVNLHPNDILVSFDVVSMYTCIPKKEAVQVLRKKRVFLDSFCNIIEGCLDCNYFSYEGTLYKQTEGLAMGSPLSPLVANFFMEDLEEEAIKTATLKPKYWGRYVDDVICVWPHGEEELEIFFDHLNKINQKIKFTMEKEINKKLPYLDLLLENKLDGTLGHSVYRKITNTNRYLHASSHHTPAQKIGVLQTLITRSLRLSDSDNLANEMSNLKNIFQENGYSKQEIDIAIKKATSPPIERKDEGRVLATVQLPYVRGTTDKISNLLRKHNIKTVFTTDRKLNSYFRPVKDTIHLESCGVYKVPCECGLVYIGQTKKPVSGRLKQHKYHERTKNEKLSAIAQHALSDGNHQILYDQTEILDKQIKRWPRAISEAIEIIKHPRNFNREDGFVLSKSWETIINKLKIQNTAHPTSINAPSVNLSSTSRYNLRSNQD